MSDASMTNYFNAYTCPLDRINLIEAGAGTGKTYNIQILVLRLVLAKVDIRKILVVTFTEAATAELRDRIHRILDAMRDALAKLTTQKPERHNAIIAALDSQIRELFLASNPAPRQPDWRLDLPGALKTVRDALRCFDQAPISTIHGFCHRMLHENAFESGIRFGLEPRTDITALMNEIVHDFARAFLYPADALRIRLAASLGITPASLLNDIGPAARNLSAAVDWGLDQDTLNNLESALNTCEAAIGRGLEKAGAEAHWQNQPDVPPNLQLTGFKKTFAPEAISRFRQQLAQGDPIATSQLRQFSTSALADMISTRSKDGKKIAAEISRGRCYREFTGPFDMLVQAMDQYRNMVRCLALKDFLKKLEHRKSRDNFLTFDDMLTKLDLRLQGDHGERLAEIIRAKYSCALVDEFQDTDPVQYSIFHRLFAQSSQHAFFMIGDPKQAIYSFRGGDIFAYLVAADNVPTERRYTLATNFRSSDAFLDALNAFYDSNGADAAPPFGRPDITCATILKPAGNSKTFTSRGQIVANPLTISLKANKSEAEQNIVDTIVALTTNPNLKITLDGPPRRPRCSDIAILVRVGTDGNSLEKRLLDRGIPVIWANAGNVFNTREADELLDLLQAISHFSDSRLVNQVLASRLFAVSAEDLLRLQDDMPAIQQYFESLNDMWQKKSFLAMLRRLLEQPHDQDRQWLTNTRPEVYPPKGNLSELIAQQDHGERILTNLNHLGELLHQTATQRRLGQDALIAFLKNQRKKIDAVADNSAQGDDESLALRMATQNDAVLIMTLHKSKGLQFPFVFIPHLPQSQPDSRDILYHDEQGRRCLDMTPDHIHQKNSYEEALQENMRILYVGLTRAIFACHVAYSTAKSGQHSLHHALQSRFTAWTIATLPEYAAPTPAENPAPTPTENPAPTPAEDPAPPESVYAERPFPALSFTVNDAGRLRPGWRTCSFTSLGKSATAPAAQKPDDAEAFDPADTEAAPPEQEPQGGLFDEDDDAAAAITGGDIAAHTPERPAGAIPFADREPIFQFPAGKRAGLFWHSIFENLDFQSSDAQLETALTEQLDLYSLLPTKPERRERQQQAFINMTRAILHNTLPGDFRLADVPPERRLAELRFLYRLRHGFHSADVAALLRDHGVATPESWDNFARKDTAMTG
ncbi:MAG: UvrD-helicase domain-containing protein, partial [Lentisphaeria bacterium]|nr:UvrD-helicase domain-containing protein [Lentisphaeria bacterium]